MNISENDRRIANEVEHEAAWEAATAEGLAFFLATMHAGHSIQFVGQSWEEGGFFVNDDGTPRGDSRGNTVATHTTEALDPANPQHVAQVREWYEG